jgi:aldehyde:ferredoxin oxidoreductase
MKGNTGKIICVNLLEANISVESLPFEYYTQFIGGSGLAAKLFLERGYFNADPLSPDAMLIFANGPFAGLKLPGASRNCAAGRSPLNNAWADSSCGGYFAPELRFAGYDGLIITGKAKTPSLLVIQDDSIEIRDASAFWGKGVLQTHSELKQEFGKEFRTAMIGPAGENLVKYAAIVSEGHHVFGRAGLGAIMGSKNLKAIIVKGSNRSLDVADPVNYETLRKDLLKRSREFPINEHTHAHGSAGNLEAGMQIGDVPVKNWTSNYNEEMGKSLAGPTLTEKYLKKRAGCQFCSIACKRVVEIKDGPFAIAEGPGPEYETIVAFGSLLGSADLAAACKSGRLCNDLGMDTISAGATIAWAMEAFEKGDLNKSDMDGLELKWGDMESVVTILQEIAYRRGKLANLLAEGSLKAAQITGKDSVRYTAQCKGLEAPMHDPRGGGHGLALSYAVSPRGACHVSDTMLFIEMGFRYPEVGFNPADMELRSDKYKTEAAVVALALGCMKNSACWCMFADLSMSIKDYSDLFNYVAGYGWSLEDMMDAGKRVYLSKRLINYRFEFRAQDDDLSQRMLEPANDGLPKGIIVKLPDMKSRFYNLMGLDLEKGVPVKEKITTFKMEREARIAGLL